MKQVIQSARGGRLALREVPDPRVRAGHLLVATRASLISAGTERMVIDFARKSLAAKARARPDLVRKVIDKARRDGVGAALRAALARLDEPLPLGYSASGDVVAVGEGLEGRFRVGDRVAVAGAGLANHAELNVVPAALAAVMPDGLPYEEACYGTLAAIALHAVRNAGTGLGDVVAVLGVGLLGQIAARLLTLAGARVIALDVRPARLDLARVLGAEAAFDLARPGLEEGIAALTRGCGCDAVVVAAATDSDEPLAQAAAIARDRATVCLVGKTGTAFPFAEYMKKELNIVVSRGYGPGRYDDAFEGRGVKYPVGFVRWTETENLAECLRLMAPERIPRLDVVPLTTHRFPLRDAAAAYDLVTGGGDRLGVVLTYDLPDARRAAPVKAFARPRLPAGRGCVLGVIGAGAFARSVLLPEIGRIPGVVLHTLAARRGAGAEQAARAFGFANATADEAAVLDDPEITAVLVATRHDSHSELAARALKAGKCVFVEKPLGLSRADISRVVAAREGAPGFLQVGFNRRFAPHSVAARARLAAKAGPRYVLVRVNAGRLPPEHWTNAPDEGGGRVLGEVCHFVDLARFLVGGAIVSVQADSARAAAGGGCEDVSVSLGFADGSLATIAYTALGDGALAKERIEAYAGGTAVIIDDFRSIAVAEDGRLVPHKGSGQDKGIAAELAAFAAAVAAGGPAPVDEAELVETSLATVAVLESLREGRRVEP